MSQNITVRRSSDRRWDRPIKQIDRKPVGYRQIACKTPECGCTEDLVDRTTDGLPADMIQRKFEQKGWTVGADSRFDFCPRCTEAATVARRAKRNSTKPVLVPSPATQPDEQPEVTMTEATPVANPVVTMTREDRKIIHNRLTELYVDENTGYRIPWNDAKVATDLGASVAWITEIREQFFGPEVDNPLLDELRTQMASDRLTMETLGRDMAKLQRDGDSLVSAIKTLAGQMKAAQDRQAVTVAKFAELLT